MRFHEIRTKSALNRVPASRGCRSTGRSTRTEDAAMPVLTACAARRRSCWPTVATRAIADLRVGDRIYGTDRAGRYRRYVRDRGPRPLVDGQAGVPRHARGRDRARRQRRSPLPDASAAGSTCTGAEQGPTAGRISRSTTAARHRRVRRPRPADDADYRRGYLCGMIRGDGHLGSYAYARRAPGRRRVHRFRSRWPISRRCGARSAYLADLGVATRRVRCSRRLAGAIARCARSGRSSRAAVEPIRELIALAVGPERTTGARASSPASSTPRAPAAGIAAHREHRPRRSSSGPPTCLRRLGFRYVVEDRDRPNGLRCVRLLGGTPEQLRFFHTVDPAITRKRSIDGPRDQVRRPTCGSRRSSRSGSRCRCTTSRPAPATSSPTACQPQLLRPARRTSTWT